MFLRDKMILDEIRLILYSVLGAYLGSIMALCVTKHVKLKPALILCLVAIILLAIVSFMLSSFGQ